MSSDSSDDELDITKSVALDADSSSDGDEGSDTGYLSDEIVSSDDEEEDKNENKGFPNLELSDSEDEEDNGNHKGVESNTKELMTSSFFTKQNEEAHDSSDEEEEEDDDHEDSTTIVKKKQKKEKEIKSFSEFKISSLLQKNVERKGFRTPTPIQQKAIPLILNNRDVVGMARTGSGKTAAFILPMIEKLKTHSAKVGIRAIIMSPSRELALQTVKVVDDFTKGTNLRTAVLIGGDSLEEQFGFLMKNPDIIIATPGRFLHLQVEMKLNLSTIEYIVFDEADRLFESGFSEQLNGLLDLLPPTRQTLLFSATLPKLLVEFAKAGLQNPILIRLDAESKISNDLSLSFFSVKKDENESALLYILKNVIKMPFASPEVLKALETKDKDENDSDDDNDARKKKFKNNKKNGKKFKKGKFIRTIEDILPSEFSSIIFVPTKHHVEYITTLLKKIGYATAYVYGSLDQHARRDQLKKFRSGQATIMVVTDVAARGIDIPLLANVINYTLPSNPKIFIHRVGRTARAGHKGWAYSIIREQDLPYLLDLEVFLGKKLLFAKDYIKVAKGKEPPIKLFSKRLTLGSIPRTGIESSMEIVNSILVSDYDLQMMKDVAKRGEEMYTRTKTGASMESVKRTKELLSIANTNPLNSGNISTWNDIHLLFATKEDKIEKAEQEKLNFLAKLGNRRNKETVFEFLSKGNGASEAAILMQKRRIQIAPIRRKAEEKKKIQEMEREAGLVHGSSDQLLNSAVNFGLEDGEEKDKVDMANEDDIESTFGSNDRAQKQKKKNTRDKNYLQHYTDFEAPYQLSSHTFDLNGDEGKNNQSQKAKWDKKKGKYVKEGVKLMVTENGTKLPATYRSGRFESWKNKNKTEGPKVGTVEISNNNGNRNNERRPGESNINIMGYKKFQHNKQAAPKKADKFRDNYEKQKKKYNSRTADKAVNELKSTSDIYKERINKQKRMDKNARPTKRKRTK